MPLFVLGSGKRLLSVLGVVFACLSSMCSSADISVLHLDPCCSHPPCTPHFSSLAVFFFPKTDRRCNWRNRVGGVSPDMAEMGKLTCQAYPFPFSFFGGTSANWSVHFSPQNPPFPLPFVLLLYTTFWRGKRKQMLTICPPWHPISSWKEKKKPGFFLVHFIHLFAWWSYKVITYFFVVSFIHCETLTLHLQAQLLNQSRKRKHRFFFLFRSLFFLLESVPRYLGSSRVVPYFPSLSCLCPKIVHCKVQLCHFFSSFFWKQNYQVAFFFRFSYVPLITFTIRVMISYCSIITDIRLVPSPKTTPFFFSSLVLPWEVTYNVFFLIVEVS